MNIISKILVLSASSVILHSVNAGELVEKKQKFNYAIGVQFGSILKDVDFEMDEEPFMQGLRDSLYDNKLQLSHKEVTTLMNELQKHQAQVYSQRSKTIAKKNLDAGKNYLSENKKRKEVKSTKSGLQYEVLAVGKGAEPGVNDTVKVNYRGTLINGKEFDSSYKRGQPAEFPVKGVIPGWSEALQMMRKGSKWKLYIPPELAYGADEIGIIEPNSTLLFEVELLEIKSAKS